MLNKCSYVVQAFYHYFGLMTKYPIEGTILLFRYDSFGIVQDLIKQDMVAKLYSDLTVGEGGIDEGLK